MDTAVNWLNSGTGHLVLSVLGGFLLKRWPAFPTRVVPVALLAANVVTVLALGLNGAHAGTIGDVGTASGLTAAAIGTHSGVKNVWQFLTGLVGLRH